MRASTTEQDDWRLLVRSARQGQKAAIGQLVQQHQRAVYALVGRMLVDHPSHVDDVAQEVFLKVIKHLKRFDPDGPAKLSTWILTIATRTSIDVLRKRGRNRPLGDAIFHVPDGGDPEQAATQRQHYNLVVEAMAQLPAEQRAVLILRAYHDFDTQQIAGALGVEPGTVKSRLSRARATLQRLTKRDRDVVSPTRGEQR